MRGRPAAINVVMTQGVGLSVGATNVAAVVVGGAAVTRRSVLTLFRHRPPEVGLPSENPRLHERGLVVTGFVDRTGDPIGLIAADSSFHRGEALTADALRSLTYAATAGRAPASPPGVTFPTHWRTSAVDALRRELAAMPEWSGEPARLTLISDAAAALTALQAEPGLPARGVVALCDFGGTGTSITLADAADGYRPIGATVRHADFSGELVDRALLAHVIADVSIAGTADVAGTAAIGSLHRLRADCRGAKERLSRSAVTTLCADVPGYRGEVRLTRAELDDEIRQPLTAFIEVLREHLFRNRIHPADLTAIATVGGGAGIPAVTTALSELRVPVITTPHPELTAARGAAILAGRRPEDDSLTAVASAAQSGTLRALAWSEVDDVPDIIAIAPYSDVSPGLSAARPSVGFVPEAPARAVSTGQPWYRPVLVSAGIFAAMLFVGTGAVMALRNDASAMTGTTTATTTVRPDPTTPAAAPPAELPATPEQSPAGPSFIQAPAPVTRIVTAPPAVPMVAPAAPPAAAPLPAAPAPADNPPPPSPQPPPSATTPPNATPPSPPPSSPPSSPAPPSSEPPNSSSSAPTSPPKTPPSHEEPPPSHETPPEAGDTSAPEPPPSQKADQPK